MRAVRPDVSRHNMYSIPGTITLLPSRRESRESLCRSTNALQIAVKNMTAIRMAQIYLHSVRTRQRNCGTATNSMCESMVRVPNSGAVASNVNMTAGGHTLAAYARIGNDPSFIVDMMLAADGY